VEAVAAVAAVEHSPSYSWLQVHDSLTAEVRQRLELLIQLIGFGAPAEPSKQGSIVLQTGFEDGSRRGIW
jgi:hypothetical protein